MYKIIAQNVSQNGKDFILNFNICSDIESRQALKVYRQLKKGMNTKVIAKINFETLSSIQKWIIGKALLLPKHSERFNSSQKEVIEGLFIRQDRVNPPVLSKKVIEGFLSVSRSLLPENKDFSRNLYCSNFEIELESIIMKADKNDVTVMLPIFLPDGEPIKSFMEVAKQFSNTHKKYCVLYDCNLKEAFPDDISFSLFQENTPYLIVGVQNKSYEQCLAILQNKGCSIIPVLIVPEGYV